MEPRESAGDTSRELKCRPCGMTEGPEVEEGSGNLQSGNWQELGATVKLTTPVPE